jgi:hypothetical protein
MKCIEKEVGFLNEEEVYDGCNVDMFLVHSSVFVVQGRFVGFEESG